MSTLQVILNVYLLGVVINFIHLVLIQRKKIESEFVKVYWEKPEIQFIMNEKQAVFLLMNIVVLSSWFIILFQLAQFLYYFPQWVYLKTFNSIMKWRYERYKNKLVKEEAKKLIRLLNDILEEHEKINNKKDDVKKDME